MSKFLAGICCRVWNIYSHVCIVPGFRFHHLGERSKCLIVIDWLFSRKASSAANPCLRCNQLIGWSCAQISILLNWKAIPVKLCAPDGYGWICQIKRDGNNQWIISRAQYHALIPRRRGRWIGRSKHYNASDLFRIKNCGKMILRTLASRIFSRKKIGV